MKLLAGIPCALVLSAGFAFPAHSTPLGTGFTFQGQLDQNGVPVNGTAHLRFSLWDAAGTGSPPIGGNPVGGTQIASDVPVADGVFSVILNEAGQFGSTAFNGDARWLQIEVCVDANCLTFTTLSPRQPVTATPYSLDSAGPWTKNGTNLSYFGGKIGIGMAAPVSAVDIAGFQDGLRITGFQPFMTFRDSNFGNSRTVIQSVAGALSFFTENYANGSNPSAFVHVTNSGNLGLGTATPAAKLDVRGSIRLGTNGQHYATGGEEDLRIMRGVVDANGAAPYGCCFAVERPFPGMYTVTFTTPFSGPPVVTVTPQSYGGTAANLSIAAAGYFQVNMFLDGDLVNTWFDFIAIGPR